MSALWFPPFTNFNGNNWLRTFFDSDFTASASVLSGASGFTLCFWINVTDDGRDQNVLGNDPNFRVFVRDRANDFKLEVRLFGGNINTALNYGQTYFVAATSFFANGFDKNLYIDGVLVDHKNSSNTGTAQNRFYLGSDRDGQAEDYAGTIDDFRVYTKALTPDEIMTIYLSDGKDHMNVGLLDGRIKTRIETDSDLPPAFVIPRYVDNALDTRASSDFWENWEAAGNLTIPPKSVESHISSRRKGAIF